ncbi:diacylglycerol/lipid kinase family protein [Klenkia brasiliensis]|uniref:Diacylglycerol kinase family enzyme n=1 Tax=Klenkia brasiliensis TaxID=333142 RepID=A0A1G7VSM3_9ACTN|nr:diacylglycerol kinase family protein [Klenkia brasiliensis]SDG62805.1 Diacylglycerol kinase family enzyme [Klenkia brasiliensis]
MAAFDRVVIVFNPNSTGDAPTLARELRDDLAERHPDLPIDLAPTQRAGHGRELAAEAAREGRPLVVSVSGDGGYNDVVNGLMDAGNPDAVAAVRGAGNANDHRRATKRRPLDAAVSHALATGRTQRFDLLRLTLTPAGGEPQVRYAHSYIGLGITPVVAVDLEEGGKGSWREILAVVRGFRRFRPFPVELADGRRIEVDSLLYANIDRMAKVATLSHDGRPDDGEFELVLLPHRSKLRVLLTALRSATVGLGPQPHATSHELTIRAPMPLQLDGELVELDTDTHVAVDIVPGALRTVG